MIKNYGFAAVFFASSAIAAYSNFSSAAINTDHLPLPDALQAHADEINRSRDRFGDATLERAFVRGNTIIVDLAIRNAPAKFDASATNAKFQANMERKFCRSGFTSLLRRGGGLVFRFSTSGGRALMDGRVDASACRLT